MTTNASQTTASIPVIRIEPLDGSAALEFTPHEAENFDVEPLDHRALVAASHSENPVVPLLIRNANAPSALTGKDRDGPLEVSFLFQQDGRISAYGLVLGGWLPLPWAHERVAFLDRNVVIALEKFGGPDVGVVSCLLVQVLSKAPGVGPFAQFRPGQLKGELHLWHENGRAAQISHQIFCVQRAIKVFQVWPRTHHCSCFV